MSARRDMIFGAIACIVIFFFFVSIDLYQTVADYTDNREGFVFVELLAAVPTLALVTSWFAVRRWLEVTHLNDRLAQTVGQLNKAIEDRKAMEEQIGEAYKMAALGQLAGGLTRELNNVLQPIVTLSQLELEQENSAVTPNENLQRIRLVAERGCKILESSLANPTGGLGEATEIDLSQGLSRVVSQVQNSLGNEVAITTRFVEDGGTIKVNHEDFDSVFTVLLTNAVQASEPGDEVVVGFSSHVFNEPEARKKGVSAGTFFCVTVADVGSGMSEDVCEQVFDPFFTTKSAEGATGLGLTIAYEQAHRWSGVIHATSVVDEGSTFEVLIPRYQPESGEGV
ncbi:MAG: HAMP domain-containing histidine kinase [Acidimicrobiia bacterium]|nr:HAMP domain-containing histidine kinase [Acidimicrobiia bacterium]MCY4458627.1 HAMP domain-containing sensor histidine kinase [Acidimicrobiaceae bacterium]